MAILAHESPLQGLRGTLGHDIVFKKYNDKTVVSKKPSGRKRNSGLQEINCNRFREASRHARTILRDPIKREHYRKLAKKQNKHSAYNMIISEYMLSISISRKDTGGNVPVAKRLTLSVTKKGFRVKEVSVAVKAADDRVVAEGRANPVSTVDWVYKLPDECRPGSTVIITAVDAFGLITQKQLLL